MTKKEPKKLDNGLYELENVIDTRTGKHHSVAQVRKADLEYFEDAE